MDTTQPTTTATSPAKMSLHDYDRWMTELSNQQRLKDNPNLAFRDPTQGSWTDWIGGRQRIPQSYNVGTRYSATGQAGSTMVDPTTGQAEGGPQYKYDVAYRPQTGNQAQDWVTENMAHGIQPKSDWAKTADTFATAPTSRLGGGGLQYNPGGGSMWSNMTQDQMNNPNIAETIRKGMGSTNMADQATYRGLWNKVDPKVRQGIEGSSFSLEPDILAKMWR